MPTLGIFQKSNIIPMLPVKSSLITKDLLIHRVF